MHHKFWVDIIYIIKNPPYAGKELIPFAIIAIKIFPSLKYQVCPHKITRVKK